jgi:dTDP-L-rhamnose 4-epimerase
MSQGKALVTGGAGLIGSHLVDLLVEKGYDVTVLDNLEPQTHPQGKPAWLNPNARFIQGDVRNESDLDRALQGVRFVFHQAAFGGFTEEISKYIEVNVSGTARLFERIATGKFPVEKVVVASSQAVYGEGAYECAKEGEVFPPLRAFDQLAKRRWEPSCPRCEGALRPSLTSEEKPREGNTPYALSKEFEERLALGRGRELRIPVAALRYGVTYGPRQSVFNPYTGVVSIFSTRILNDLPPVGYEDGLQTRDFIFVEDVARANLFVLENPSADFQVFNVGTGKATSVAELARILSSIYRRSIEPEIPGEFRRGDVRHILLNPKKLNQLGFSAAIPLKEGLARFAEWIESQERVDEFFTEAYHNLKKHRIISS